MISTDAAFLLSHGWTRIEGTRPGAIYWRDPHPESLEPMLAQTGAVRVQKERNRREGKTTSTERGRT